MLSVYIAGLKKQTGKTLLASGLAATMQSLSYTTGYYKPIQTGLECAGFDADFVNKMDSHIKTSTCYKLQSSYHPLIGMYLEGNNNIDTMKILHDYKQNMMMCECHIVEGNNGLSSPFAEKKTEINLISQFSLPLILVVNPNITKIDDVISGINYIYSNNIKFLGVVINDYKIDTEDIEVKYFPHLLKEYTGVKILGSLPHYDNFKLLTPQTLISDVLNRLNIEDIFSLKIAKLA